MTAAAQPGFADAVDGVAGISRRPDGATETAAVAIVDGAPQPLMALDAGLLAWLAVEGPTARSKLVALLWPLSEADAGRNALRQRLFRLRRTLGLDAVQGQATLALAGAVAHDLDDARGLLEAVPAPATAA